MRNTFANTIFEMAKSDKRIVVLTADQDTGLEKVKAQIPDQYFVEGIAEANVVGMAAGLASEGFIPYVVAIASFLTRRCFEQNVIDVCLHKFPVRLIGLGAGLNYAHLGPTHQAIEDISIMRAIPNMTVMVPCDADEMKRAILASLDWPYPMYFRVARYGKPIVSKEECGFKIGEAIMLKKPQQEKDYILLVSTGAMTPKAVAAVDELEREGIDCSILHVHTVKPIDTKEICNAARRAKLLVTLEEHTIVGGFGSSILEALSDNLLPRQIPKIMRIGLPDNFIDDYGTQESLLQKFGLEANQIAEKLLKTVLKDSH